MRRSLSTAHSKLTSVTIILLWDSCYLSILILSVISPHGWSGVNLLLEILICIGSRSTVAKCGSYVTSCGISGLLLRNLRSVLLTIVVLGSPSRFLLIWIWLSLVVLIIMIIGLFPIGCSLWVILVWLIPWNLVRVVVINLVAIYLVIQLLLVVLILHLNYEFAKFINVKS